MRNADFPVQNVRATPYVGPGAPCVFCGAEDKRGIHLPISKQKRDMFC